MHDITRFRQLILANVTFGHMVPFCAATLPFLFARFTRLRNLGGTLFDPGEQLRKRNLKRAGNQHQIVKTQITLPTLDRAHPGPVQTSRVGEAFLRIALPLAQLPHSLSQRLQHVAGIYLLHNQSLATRMPLRLQ